MEILSSSRHTINSHCMQGNAETMAANRLSFFFNLTGPSITYNTACSSSLVAIHGAVQAIQSGECGSDRFCGPFQDSSQHRDFQHQSSK